MPIFATIVVENTSGYVCSVNSIGCSSLSSLYKVEQRSNGLFICTSGSIGNCSLMEAFYKLKYQDEDTIYICPVNSIGCSSFSALYKIEKHDEDTSYVCSGDSIGCSSLSDIYRIEKYSDDMTYVCPGDSIGCSSFSALYKMKKENITGGGGFSGSIGNICPLNAAYQNGQCICNTGYVASGSVCITYTQNCQIKYGMNSYGDKDFCYCLPGYIFNSTKTVCIQQSCPINSTLINGQCSCNYGYIMRNNICITYTEDCIQNFGPNIIGAKGVDNSLCTCAIGYQWNSTKTACILMACQLNASRIGNICVCNAGYINKNSRCITYTEDCIEKFGPNVYGVNGGNDSLCICSEGYQLNVSKTACEKIDIKPTSLPPTVRSSEIKDIISPKDQGSVSSTPTVIKLDNINIQEDPSIKVTTPEKTGFFRRIFKVIGGFLGRIFR